ncbi:ABC transporter permease [Siccirubricoccus sp. KC 17139]|uniref:ABC transporter permease n=1 Tax=Siccirubricoccus soli TaxID=2899147 RepID=A0ABT1D7W8_9PROT|nr:ABC transporter permease [Siccirubricoccus soli]MCO6417269.1 ABC transporter permease [Siccirubricoccus soli]MCP2683404.1 ABC transporter permease [Siccirubricoccus soli]
MSVTLTHDGAWRRGMDRLRRIVAACGGPAGCLGAAIVLALLVLAVFATWIAPHDPLRVSLPDQLLEPGGDFPFGTDQSGRDVLSRVIWASRASLAVAGVAVLIGLALGVTLGLSAGFFRGGWAEQAIMRLLDAVAAIPVLIWAIALVGIFGIREIEIGPFTFGNEVKLMLMLGLLYVPTLARITYTSAASESQANYVAARRLQGVPGWRIMLSDVLPNCLSPVIVQATLMLALGIIIEASVSFVGLGVQPPTPSWGNMLADARNYLLSGEWWLSVFPGAAISVTVIGFNLLGDGLRDRLDPRHALPTVAG